MEISEKYFRELLFDTDALEAVSALDRFWCTHLDASERTWLGLSEPEHHVHLCIIYLGEVGNGGHTQFFLNRCGDIAARALRALEATELGSLRECLAAACAVFPGGVVPADQLGVEHVLGQFSENQLERLDALDQTVYSIRDVDGLLLAYLRRHEGELLRRERGLT
jgi:hypothetical protein